MDLIFVLLVHLEILALLKILSLRVYDYDAIAEYKCFAEKEFTDYFIITTKDLVIKIYFKQACDDFFFIIVAAEESAAGLKFIVVIFENY